MTYFNFGIRSGGGIGDVIGAQPYRETYWYLLRWATDMIFYITVILLVMNMINGIIISTFSTLREEDEKKENDKLNKCFICSLSRIQFEKYKINFEFHTQKEHNFHNYIKYLIILKLTPEREQNADQSYIYKCLKSEDIAFFPLFKAKSLADVEIEREDEEDDD